MPAGRLILEHDLAPQQALLRGSALPRALGEGCPVALFATTLQGDALVLGFHQLASQALAKASAALITPEIMRRSSGGASVHAGSGVIYAALALRDRSSLMATPPGRLLNRNVRGVLQGLRLAGAAANYFGRDFLSFGARPAAYAAWDADDDGHVLFEFFISHTTSCFVTDDRLGYPPREQPALRGQTPTSLEEVGASEFDNDALLEKIAEGHSKSFGVVWQRAASESLNEHLAAPLASTDTVLDRSLTWSPPREEAIGFVSAGVALDQAGKFARVRVAGDFFAHRGCGATLERVLLGVTPAPDLVARAVDAAFAGGHTGHDLEGIRQLRTFQDAIIDAADAAVRDLNERGAP